MNGAVKAILFIGVGALSFALLALGMDSGDTRNMHTVAVADREAETWNEHLIDSAAGLLQTGNVVLRMGMGAQSNLLARMNRVNKSYSHCGIVLVENGYPFVYHSIGGEDNPDARLRRDSAVRFLAAEYNTAIAIVKYDLGPEKEQLLREAVVACYNNRPKFDLQFDLATDDKLYCTEFVYKILTKVSADTSYIPVTSIAGRQFVGTDNLYTNSHADLIWQVKFK